MNTVEIRIKSLRAIAKQSDEVVARSPPSNIGGRRGNLIFFIEVRDCHAHCHSLAMTATLSVLIRVHSWLNKFMVKKFLAALQFLTIIPIPRGIRIEKQDSAGSLIFFPLVGLFMGGALLLMEISLNKFVSPLILNLLLLLVWVGITGALHLDGLADTVDGFSGGRNKEEILKIMTDSCIGAKGAAALILFLGAKFLFLCQLPFTFRNYALLFTPALGRWAMVLAMTFSSYAKKEGLGRIFVEGNDKKEALITSLLMILLGLLLFKSFFIYLLFGILLITFLLLTIFKRRIRGITGDNLGAINEIIEVVTLLIICLL